MVAADILDIQALLLDRLTEPNSKMAQLVKTQFAKTTEGHLGQTMGNADFVPRDLVVALRGAESFHVDADMTPLIEWAAAGLDETDRFRMDMAPAGVGFARFAQPLTMNDARGKVMKANLLVWVPRRVKFVGEAEHTVTMFYYFNDLADPDDYGDELLQEYGRDYLIAKFGRWQLAGYEWGSPDQRMGPAMVMPNESQAARILADGAIPSAYTNLFRQFYAFWMLCEQTVTTRSEAEIPRAFARRARRANIPPRVSVIHLRRRENAAEGVGETRVEWHHRWIVRGKWQWRRCGPNHPFAEPYDKGWRCRVYIDDYVKGPAGKPLKQSTKVYSLDR